MFDRFIFKDVGTSLVPISDFKCNPLVAPALIAAGGSILGGITSLFGSKKANDTNIKIARENRDWQTLENQKQRDYETEMWNKTNFYNTPSAQMKRLREAGINPFISGSGGYSNISQIPSAPGMQGAPNAPIVQNEYEGFASALQNGISSTASLAQVGANVANQNAKTAIDAIKAYTEFLTATDGNYSDAKKLLGTLLKPLGYSSKQMEDIMHGQNLNYMQTRIASDRQALEYNLLHRYGERKADAELRHIDKLIEKLDSDIVHNKSLNSLNDAQVEELAQRTAKELEETTTIKESRNFIIKKLEMEAKILEADPMADGTFATMFKGVPVLGNLLKLIVMYLKK